MILNIFRGSALREVAMLVAPAAGPARSCYDEPNEACCPDYWRIVRHWTGNRRAPGRLGSARLQRRPCSRNSTSAGGHRGRAACVPDETSSRPRCVGERLDRRGDQQCRRHVASAVEETSISQAQAVFETYRMRLPIGQAALLSCLTGCCRPGCSSQAAARQVRAQASRNRPPNPERAACSISSAWSSPQS